MFNTVVAASAFLVDPTVRSDTRRWYSLGGSLIVNVMLGDCLFIQPLLDWVRVDVLFSRRVRAPRASTQLQMNEAYVARAGIYLAFRLQVGK